MEIKDVHELITATHIEWLNENENSDEIKCACCNTYLDYVHGVAQAHVKDFVRIMCRLLREKDGLKDKSNPNKPERLIL